MREIACAVCEGTSRRTVYESTIRETDVLGGKVDPYGAHYRIVQCQRCGLLYANPIFDEIEVQTLYTASPHTNIAHGEEVNVRRTMELYYETAKPWLLGRERMLDIGCDIGLLLDIARLDGFKELHGIEPVPVAAAEARKVPGAIISSDFYEDQDYPAAHFDFICLIHVVDHLVNPTPLLDRAMRHLKPGGVLLAVVHNSNSLLGRLLGEKFPPYNLYHHYYFSQRTFRLLFQKSGFEILRVGPSYNCYSIGTFAEKTPLAPAWARTGARRVLDAVGVGPIPLTVPLGNISIAVRRPLA
jgi:SAM-dependent methyltransferase